MLNPNSIQTLETCFSQARGSVGPSGRYDRGDGWYTSGTGIFQNANQLIWKIIESFKDSFPQFVLVESLPCHCD